MQLSYSQFFKCLVGNDPYPYQERVAELLLQGKSIILRAPTGAGKTWAVVVPYLYSLIQNRPLGDRLIYSLPLRSLATSIHANVISAIKRYGQYSQIITTGKDRDYTQNDTLYCCLHIGIEQNDPFFESDLLFTTIDQTLSNYLFLPVSLSDRVSNINAGALIGAYLIFDELHLLGPGSSLGTTIEMLCRLSQLSQFVLMTATQSDRCMEWLSKKLNAALVHLTPQELNNIPSLVSKQRSYHWRDHPLTAEDIWEQYEGGRVIVLANSVPRAQQIFQELQTYVKEKKESIKLLLLHSRYYPQHRKPIEEQIQQYFGPNSVDANLILVATQVIEAGMDISAECMHTELAPMNTLIQRAGRVARYANRNKGKVIVYELETQANGERRLGPYKDDACLVDQTRNVLQTLPPSGMLVDYEKELNWLCDVHEQEEIRQLSQYDNLYTRAERVKKAIEEGDRGLLSELVRDADGVNVLISDDPESVLSGNSKNPRWPLLLSVSPEALISELGSAFQEKDGTVWIAKGAKMLDESEGAIGEKLLWEPIKDDKEFFAQWLIAIHPNYAAYDAQYGLRLGMGGPQPPLCYLQQKPMLRSQYSFELWEDHAKRVRSQALLMAKKYRKATELLASKYGFSREYLEDYVEIVCLLHDAGKLSEDWQRKAWCWQILKEGETQIRDRAIAHTSFDPDLDRETMAKYVGQLPPHAVEGAFAVASILYEFLQGSLSPSLTELPERVASCLITAIARHHHARAANCSTFELAKTALPEIRRVLPKDFIADDKLDACSCVLDARVFSDKLLMAVTKARDEQFWPLYCFLVRRLRLADQGSIKSS